MPRQIILDTETTGLSTEKGHRIIEIACLEMIDRKITNNHYHCYLNPERSIEIGALNVHGLTEEFLANKSKFSDIADDFLAFVNNAELIIHNAKFDIRFINHELKLANAKVKSIETCCTVTDTLLMARRKHPGQRNSLDALCKRYNVDNSKRTLHGALIDCELLASVYLYMTGGQKKLFEEKIINNQKPALKKSQSKINEQHQLLVIEPSAIEQEAHNAFLDHLKKTAGDALWCLQD